MTDPTKCGFRPFPDNIAYSHWICQLHTHHRGRHRFNNYTIARVPHVHRGVDVVARAWLRHQRRVLRHLVKYRKLPRVDLSPNYRLHWRSRIWPTDYDPLDSQQAARYG